MEALEATSLHIEPPLSPKLWSGVLDTADQYRLTAYDAAYLQLALQTGLPLATLDDELQKAATKAGVALL